MSLLKRVLKTEADDNQPTDQHTDLRIDSTSVNDFKYDTPASPPQPQPLPKKYPKIQCAQKCAWCGRYLFGGDDIATYNGPDEDYEGWMCHAECNLHDIEPTTVTRPNFDDMPELEAASFVDLEKQELSKKPTPSIVTRVLNAIVGDDDH